MRKQAHAFYSGRVQGIGFRFTALHIANTLGVHGWVRNMPDGRVEILAEAEEEVLNKFLDEVSKSFSYYIDNVNNNWKPALGKFKDFQVAF